MLVDASTATTSTLGFMMAVTRVSCKSNTLSIMSCSSVRISPLILAPITIILSSSSLTLFSSDSVTPIRLRTTFDVICINLPTGYTSIAITLIAGTMIRATLSACATARAFGIISPNTNVTTVSHIVTMVIILSPPYCAAISAAKAAEYIVQVVVPIKMAVKNFVMSLSSNLKGDFSPSSSAIFFTFQGHRVVMAVSAPARQADVMIKHPRRQSFHRGGITPVASCMLAPALTICAIA
mmetsp:Transcript_40647/g.128167  ORF Transcript_40647/g.128167 Transcript_40647/m.128167 type:complete len:238 (-) Transcript_40647:615-1328(-)